MALAMQYKVLLALPKTNLEPKPNSFQSKFIDLNSFEACSPDPSRSCEFEPAEAQVLKCQTDCHSPLFGSIVDHKRSAVTTHYFVRVVS